jgi:hypothetical protein
VGDKTRTLTFVPQYTISRMPLIGMGFHGFAVGKVEGQVDAPRSTGASGVGVFGRDGHATGGVGHAPH